MTNPYSHLDHIREITYQRYKRTHPTPEPAPEPESELIGPFPVEPAPGSPEAIRQAAETIQGLSGEPASLKDCEATLTSAYRRLKATESQRDELADALQALRRLFPRNYDPKDARRQYGLGDPLSGVEMASLDELLRKVGRS